MFGQSYALTLDEWARQFEPVWDKIKGGKFDEAPFKGETINTPSMLAVEDALDGLRWAEKVGGLTGLIQRSQANLKVLTHWVDRTEWIGFLAKDLAARSSTSVCLSFVDPWFLSHADDAQRAISRKVAGLLEAEGVAYDIASHRDSPPGLRIWCGATVETADVEALTPWLDWAYARAKTA